MVPGVFSTEICVDELSGGGSKKRISFELEDKAKEISGFYRESGGE